MGASLGSGGSSRHRRRGARGGFNDINVTPMVDVMLVLLVIFMVTAPMLTTGVPVDLPKSNAQPLPGNEDKLIVSVTRDGKIYLGDAKSSEISLSELSAKLEAIAQQSKDKQVLVHGDRQADYGAIMQVLGEINKAGLTKVGLQSDPAGITNDKRS